MIKLLLAVMLALALAAPHALAEEVSAPSFTLADAAGHDVALPSKQEVTEADRFITPD